jgi:hypothetical protein
MWDLGIYLSKRLILQLSASLHQDSFVFGFYFEIMK